MRFEKNSGPKKPQVFPKKLRFLPIFKKLRSKPAIFSLFYLIHLKKTQVQQRKTQVLTNSVVVHSHKMHKKAWYRTATSFSGQATLKWDSSNLNRKRCQLKKYYYQLFPPTLASKDINAIFQENTLFLRKKKN